MRLLHPLIQIVLTYFLTYSLLAGEEAPELSGDFIQGGLVIGHITPGYKVKINDHSVRVSVNGEFIIGFGRDYPANAELRVTRQDGSEYHHILQIEQREYKIQRINGLPKAQVSPNEKALERIKQESKNISRARSLDEERIDFKAEFIWPIKGPITGVYGSQRILNGEPRQPHYGIDVAAPTGAPVIAPAAGVVTYADNMYFSGGTLVLDHGHHLSSSFLHLDKILVQVGDRIKQGEKIALVGATGRVTGAHLDWRMNWHGQRIDPGLLMDEFHENK
ncbi:MAG: peptidoglycan DD-metalloendopeptidase family protein [Gammaproteobacteria bacterium]|nr:MAG: peptidoglycan DD-metalloendopeptidase family protein [Gammaproteobacteria bacterium]